MRALLSTVNQINHLKKRKKNLISRTYGLFN